MSPSLDKIKQMWQANKAQFQTPCYIYSISDVERNMQALKEALGTPVIYSLKANSNLDVLVRCGHLFDDGIEVASVGELNKIASGGSVKYVNNPSMDKNTIRIAISSKATLIIDNIEQLEMVGEFIGKRPVNPILLRLNSLVLKQFNPEHENFRTDHFGMDWDTAQQCLQRAKELNIDVAGFHVFKGSYSFVKTANASVKAALQIVNEFESILEKPISFVNLGGGFDKELDESFDFKAYRELLTEFPSHIQVAHEAGRGIMSSAGYFMAKVRYKKTIFDKDYLIADGGMNQSFLLAQTENTFRRYQAPEVFSLQPDSESLETPCHVVGTSCNKDDIIGLLPEGSPKANVGDVLVFKDCGAYNASYTVSPFLDLPQANVYLVE
ncbi:PLP-dependent decarboxylase [Pleionea sp. CnH1-48]|uniref:PLP-dependent decarboxylase n=1 Tax=Pleionea sp. CnH1-48 TaxID=2954494 RepID=UPI0020971DE0|nr:PLP-dependent decarboxylase [Pleionea sp. CnH1-48]MCO7225540.1 PLP-dependent decarboxylase [Pleionea sp. CnH1-48]